MGAVIRRLSISCISLAIGNPLDFLFFDLDLLSAFWSHGQAETFWLSRDNLRVF